MADKKIIAVMGATGGQGGGLVRAIQADKNGPFRARAITRDAGSAKAKEIAKTGAEVVSANADDEESLKKAFAGAHGAYCVTFFWEHFSPEKERLHAANLSGAAAETGVAHAIWSTLEDSRRFIPVDDPRMPTLMRQYKVPHFDAKGESDRFFKEKGVPTTCLLTSFYWENMIGFGMGPKRGPDGALAINFPLGDKKFPQIAVEDIGKCAYGIFKAGAPYLNRTVGIAGQHLTGNEMAAALTRALGQPVRYNDVPPDVYRKLGFPGAEDLGNMFQFNRDFADAFCAARSLEVSRALNPELQTLDQWLARNKERLPLD